MSSTPKNSLINKLAAMSFSVTAILSLRLFDAVNLTHLKLIAISFYNQFMLGYSSVIEIKESVMSLVGQVEKINLILSELNRRATDSALISLGRGNDLETVALVFRCQFDELSFSFSGHHNLYARVSVGSRSSNHYITSLSNNFEDVKSNFYYYERKVDVDTCKAMIAAKRYIRSRLSGKDKGFSVGV